MTPYRYVRYLRYESGSERAAVASIGVVLDGAPGGNRTPDILLRRQMLYPAELRARSRNQSDSNAFAAVPKIKSSFFCDYRARTVPKPSLTFKFWHNVPVISLT